MVEFRLFQTCVAFVRLPDEQATTDWTELDKLFAWERPQSNPTQMPHWRHLGWRHLSDAVWPNLHDLAKSNLCPTMITGD